jgi:hypothetical protein
LLEGNRNTILGIPNCFFPLSVCEQLSLTYIDQSLNSEFSLNIISTSSFLGMANEKERLLTLPQLEMVISAGWITF